MLTTRLTSTRRFRVRFRSPFSNSVAVFGPFTTYAAAVNGNLSSFQRGRCFCICATSLFPVLQTMSYTRSPASYTERGPRLPLGESASLATRACRYLSAFVQLKKQTLQPALDRFRRQGILQFPALFKAGLMYKHPMARLCVKVCWPSSNSGRVPSCFARPRRRSESSGGEAKVTRGEEEQLADGKVRRGPRTRKSSFG